MSHIHWSWLPGMDSNHKEDALSTISNLLIPPTNWPPPLPCTPLRSHQNGHQDRNFACAHAPTLAQTPTGESVRRALTPIFDIETPVSRATATHSGSGTTVATSRDMFSERFILAIGPPAIIVRPTSEAGSHFIVGNLHYAEIPGGAEINDSPVRSPCSTTRMMIAVSVTSVLPCQCSIARSRRSCSVIIR